MQRNNGFEVYIRFLKIFLILSLLAPVNVQAQVKPIEYNGHGITGYETLSEENVIYKPTQEALEIAWSKFVNQAIAEAQAKYPEGNKEGECVEFAKAYLGVTGTWGYGGSGLKPNLPGPEIGSVVLLRGHVAIVIAVTLDGMLALLESNYHLDGTITVGRQIPKTYSGIRGFWKPSKV